jgi:ABC-type sugar transport system substrate-binding protein
VAGQLGGRGNLVVIEGDPYNDNARNIAQGVYDTVSRYPNLRVLVDQPAAHWSPEAARTIAGEALQRYHGEIHAFVVANDAMAGGVAEAILAAGLAGSIILVGADGDEASLQRIRDGVQHGTAFQNPVELAETALSFAVATVAGTEPLGTLPLRSIFHNPPGPEVRIRDVPYLFVSRDNLAILEQYWASATRSSAQKAAS